MSMAEGEPTTHLDPATHIVTELGMAVRLAGDELRGAAPIVAEMYAPDTECVRTSILATWTDLIAGLLVGRVTAPRVPVTLELSIDLYGKPAECTRVHASGRVLKAGRSVVVTSVDFTADDEPVAMATASFMAAPDATFTMPGIDESLRHNSGGGRLTAPFAVRAGCERRAPGIAMLARSDDGLNSTNTINGGLIALAVEEAALSLAPGATVSSLAMRYLRPARVGPVIATAVNHGDLARVEVCDAGADDRLAVVATTRVI